MVEVCHHPRRLGTRGQRPSPLGGCDTRPIHSSCGTGVAANCPSPRARRAQPWVTRLNERTPRHPSTWQLVTGIEETACSSEGGVTPRNVQAASQSGGAVGLPPDAAVQQQPQPVVGEVAEAVPDPLDLLDQQVQCLGGPVGAAIGGVEGEDLGLPRSDGAGKPRQLRHPDAVCPAVEALQGGLGVGQVTGGVDRAQQLLPCQAATTSPPGSPDKLPFAVHQLGRDELEAVQAEQRRPGRTTVLAHLGPPSCWTSDIRKLCEAPGALWSPTAPPAAPQPPFMTKSRQCKDEAWERSGGRRPDQGSGSPNAQATGPSWPIRRPSAASRRPSPRPILALSRRTGTPKVPVADCVAHRSGSF